MLIPELLYVSKSFRINYTKENKEKLRKLDVNKYDTLSFIIVTWK